MFKFLSVFLIIFSFNVAYALDDITDKMALQVVENSKVLKLVQDDFRRQIKDAGLLAGHDKIHAAELEQTLLEQHEHIVQSSLISAFKETYTDAELYELAYLSLEEYPEQMIEKLEVATDRALAKVKKQSSMISDATMSISENFANMRNKKA